MGKWKKPEEIEHLLAEAERDLARGLSGRRWNLVQTGGLTPRRSPIPDRAFTRPLLARRVV